MKTVPVALVGTPDWTERMDPSLIVFEMDFNFKVEKTLRLETKDWDIMAYSNVVPIDSGWLFWGYKYPETGDDEIPCVWVLTEE